MNVELLKKYSTLDEVLLYLKDKTGYDYTLHDIYQLELEGKIEVYLYLTNPKIRLESINNNDETIYKFRFIPLKAIYKKNYKGSFFQDDAGFGNELIININSMLKVHELLEEYFLDKSIDPIPYDESHVYFSGFELFEGQEKAIEHMRFDSDQIKGLINTDIDQQNIIDQLKTENEKLRTQLALAESKTCEPVESQGYLDPNNKFFSIEMKLCHDTWNNLYKNGNNSHLPHGKQVANYLKSYPDFTINTKAIGRIKTITNPKRSLAGSETKEDI